MGMIEYCNIPVFIISTIFVSSEDMVRIIVQDLLIN